MHSTDRLEFAPPPTAGLVRALGLAIVAHALLLAALTSGVQWKRDAPVVTAQAELWSAVPQGAAPKLVEAPPAPPARLAPAPPPAPVAPKLQAAPKAPDADIALERDKLRLKKEKQQAAERVEKSERAEKLEKLAREKREQKKLALEKQREQEEQLALDKKKSEQDAKRKEALKVQQDAQKLEAQRQANLQRMAGLAGSAGAPTAGGAAQQTSGPSASYGARVSAKVKPNIVFTEDPIGNPTAVVEVRAAADGSIVSRKLLKTSGSRFWDEAVLKAIDKTDTLPRDVDGRVPPVLEISFRPRD